MSFVMVVTGMLFVMVLSAVFMGLRNIRTGNSAADDVSQKFTIERYRPMFSAA